MEKPRYLITSQWNLVSQDSARKTPVQLSKVKKVETNAFTLLKQITGTLAWKLTIPQTTSK